MLKPTPEFSETAKKGPKMMVLKMYALSNMASLGIYVKFQGLSG